MPFRRLPSLTPKAMLDVLAGQASGCSGIFPCVQIPLNPFPWIGNFNRDLGPDSPLFDISQVIGRAKTELLPTLDEHRHQNVELAVYDVLGQRVAELVEGWRTAGSHKARWDVRAHEGLASGVYFYRLQTDGGFKVGKLILLQ